MGILANLLKNISENKEKGLNICKVIINL